MKKNKKMRNFKPALFWLSFLVSGYSYADCEISATESVILSSIPSLKLTESGVDSNEFSSGLRCIGVGAGNANFMKYQIKAMPTFLKNDETGEKISISILDSNKNAIFTDLETNLSKLAFINFFNGPNNSIPFYVNIDKNQIVPPGRYTADKKLNVVWYYSIAKAAVLGVGAFSESPNFTRGLGLIGFNWGDGAPVNIDLEITISPDCKITTNNVNFGTVAFVSFFEPVQTSLGVFCSAKTPYTVSLNDGLNPQNGSQRAMKSTNSENYLAYEIYKNSTSERWGSNALELWSSDMATINPSVYNGIAKQGYAFTTKILSDDSANLPAGNYTDTITVEVKF